MTAHTIRAIHLPQRSAPPRLLPWHVVALGMLVIVAFAAMWIATVADALHPYGNPAPHR